MLCQHCNKNPANFHMQQTINGKTTEVYLCSHCANELGYSSSFNTSPFFNSFSDFSPFFAPLMGIPAISNPQASTVCPQCGMTRSRLIEDGKAGCEHCYTTFADTLNPAIRQIHGDCSHKGKLPKGASTELKQAREIDDLKHQLDTAIKAENFELAAKLRDEIKEMTPKGE